MGNTKIDTNKVVIENVVHAPLLQAQLTIKSEEVPSNNGKKNKVRQRQKQR